MNLALGIMLVTLVAPQRAPAQEGLSGRWDGYWIRAGDSMRVALTVRRDSATGGYNAEFSSDRLRVSGIPFNEVRLEGCCEVTLVLQGDRTTTLFTGRVAGDSLSGSFREGDSQGRFAYSRAGTNTPAFDEQEVSFTNGPVTLAGSLLLPRTGNAAPAVVFLHGSGAEGRWASRFLASQFAEHGVAALIFDKRGVGSSTGDWRDATPDDLAADGAAAVAWLRTQPRIDSRRVGIHGHSQGGTLAPMVAAKAPGVAFVIASAAAGVPPDSTELYSVLNSMYPQAPTARDSAEAREYVGELVAVAYRGKPRARLDSMAGVFAGKGWFFAPPSPDAGYWKFSRLFGEYRPLEWWARIKVPVLLVYGGADQRVPPEPSAERISAALRSIGNRSVVVKIFPGADHTFRLPPGPGGWPVTAPGYVDTLLQWVADRH